MTHISKRIPLVLAFVFLAIGTNDSGVRAQSSKLRVLFYGYVETKPHVAFGIIDGDRRDGRRGCAVPAARRGVIS